MKKEKDIITTWWDNEKTEREWQIAADDFFIKFVPEWFSFIGFLLTLGALRYVQQKSNSRILDLLYGITFSFFYLYLQALLFRFSFYKLLPSKFVSSKRFAFLFSITFAGVLLFIIKFFLIENVINSLSIR